MRLSENISKSSSTVPRVLNVLIVFIPIALYAMFFLGAVGSYDTIWLNALFISVGVFTLIALITRKKYAFISAYFIVGLCMATRLEMGGVPWLSMAYVPFVFLGAILFGIKGGLIFALAVPMFMARELLLGVSSQSITIIVLSSLAGGLGMLPVFGRLFRRRRNESGSARDRAFMRKRDYTDRSSIKQEGHDYDIAPPVDMDGLMREEFEPLRELLRIAVFATRATSVSLFTLSGDQLRLRCSSLPSNDELISSVPRWYVGDVLRLRHTIVTGNLGAEATQGFVNQSAPMTEEIGSGATSHDEAVSIAAAPVMELTMVVGVLAVSSPRSNAFRGNSVTVLELISAQVARTLAGSRVHTETERDMEALRMVYEESARLVSTIDLKEIIKMLADIMYNLSELDVRIYIKTPAGMALAHGGKPGKVDLSGTLAAMVMVEGDTSYISDLKGYSKPLLPDAEIGEFASALIMPLICSGETLGLVVLTSERKNPLRPEDINKLGMVTGQAGISLKNAMFHTQMKVQAVTDALTGLDNRRRLMENLEAEHRRCQRTGGVYAVVMMDIDHFKDVNDTYGHQAGDDVLRIMAERMRKVFRGTDFIGRYGGEEFAAVLVDTDYQGAFGMAERMRQSVEGSPFDIGSKELWITMSLGVAMSATGLEAEAIIGRADEALYRAKEGGRNRVEMA